MTSQEEKFILSIVKLEDEHLENNLETYSVEKYLNDEFSFNIHDENIFTKVYYVLQKALTEGILEVFIKNNILTDKLEVKDLVAFDATRFIKLVLEVLNLKLLSKKEAWGLLFLNASRIQDTFKNAEEFKTSYFKGALFYDILFKSEEDNRGEKIQNFDALFKDLYDASKVKLFWLEGEVFKALNIEESSSNLVSKDLVQNDENSNEPQITSMYKLLKKEDKTELWKLLDNFSQEERNKFLNHLYIDKKEQIEILTAEDYLELPARYPDVSYAHYLRGIYFYHFAWEARGLGLTNTVGQKNYALFYERLRYARTDLKRAYELSPNEQTYWAELYNLVKHFRGKDSDQIEEELYARIKKDAMQNTFCIKRVSHMKKARWGGSHTESLNWAREVVADSPQGNYNKIIIFEVLIEQSNYILEFDRNEEKANAIFKNKVLQNEVNQYFDELIANIAEAPLSLKSTLIFWYEKVGDLARLQKIL
ncbi:MAG: Unknown protein [uncultured Sulfurovum sp.]|uniref:DUF1266 domain-containing protein n=1 Tax=uncultured Sulfurovum sp. TaxID=269237 RepID=A0A6S6U071_9BACT|nr:MAG: Unknown protein [uncultured Sulfurovum sp.]